MNFEQLQTQWQSQEVEVPHIDLIKNSIKEQWQKRQAALRYNAVIKTKNFVVVLFALLGLLFYAREEHGIFFSGGLIALVLLLCAYLFTLWQGMGMKREHTTAPSNQYIEHCMRKLRWQRMLKTRFLFTYTILFWAAFMFYTWDITISSGMDRRVELMAYISVFIFGATIGVYHFKYKEEIRDIDILLTDLQEIKTGLAE